MVSALILLSGLLPVSFAEPEPAVAPADLALYEAAQQEAGRDAAAHIRLALWCEAHGMRAERLKHLALAVLSEPTNGMARGLMGLVAYDGQWKRPEGVADKVKADEALSAHLAEYNARRARTAETADAQWSLGVWCEQNGLEAEALAHFTAVTRLDPGREGAWKRLGCKKVGGRWLSEGQLSAEKDEAEAQKKADKHWKPLLTKWRGWLGDKTKRDAAEQALAELRDPRAVAAVWSVFVAGVRPNTIGRFRSSARSMRRPRRGRSRSSVSSLPRPKSAAGPPRRSSGATPASSPAFWSACSASRSSTRSGRSTGQGRPGPCSSPASCSTSSGCMPRRRCPRSRPRRTTTSNTTSMGCRLSRARHSPKRRRRDSPHSPA